MSKYSLNTQALMDAAAKLGDVTLYRIHKRTGIDLTVLSRITRDENGPRLDTVMRLAKTYDATVEELVSAR